MITSKLLLYKRIQGKRKRSKNRERADVSFSRIGEVEFNRQHLGGLCKEAAKNGAKIIVLPETAVTGYLSQDLKTNWYLGGRKLDKMFTKKKNPLPCAESIPGKSTNFFGNIAKEHQVYISVPLLERATEKGADYFYNSIALVDPSGEVVAHYR